MQLVDAIFSVDRMAEDAVICARAPFAPGSEAVVAKFTADFRVPVDVKAAGYEYFWGSMKWQSCWKWPLPSN
jgi:hypothetical protein